MGVDDFQEETVAMTTNPVLREREVALGEGSAQAKKKRGNLNQID